MAVLTRKPKQQSRTPRSELKKPARSLSADQVRDMARRHNVRVSPLDVEELARSYGVTLKRRPLGDDISGHLKLENGRWQITTNSLHHPNRQRFTVAHELAHFLLHTGDAEEFVDKKLFRDEARNPQESEANRFAGELLMPEEEFRSFVKETSSSVADIADHFAVSPLAVRTRARQLGFKGHGL
jgi:Zn-dependent peptidase ImmA (M78 family)